MLQNVRSCEPWKLGTLEQARLGGGEHWGATHNEKKFSYKFSIVSFRPEQIPHSVVHLEL